MHQNYKLEERVLRELIKDNVQCTEENKKLNLIIYYKNMKTRNLVMKNNPVEKPEPLQQNNVVYEFKCPLDHTPDEGPLDNQPHTYIGYTQCLLATRLTRHSYAGSIKEHCISSHKFKPSKQFIKENTSVISKAQDKQRLLIKESILILEKAPKINRQFDHFKHSLKLNPNRASSHFRNIDVNACSVTPANQSAPGDSTPSAPPLTLLDSTIEEPYNNDTSFRENFTNPLLNQSLTPNGIISPGITNRINSLISNSRNSASITAPVTLQMPMLAHARYSSGDPTRP